ncbi:MAG: dihydroxy-acid dehydratase [Candidatus Aureabacteria bacterium]|nr:dihydroxy-acid dehydratase [Candidatus Auribacterota bacterium]
MQVKEVKKLPAARSCLFGTRLDKKQIDKPLIAIFYSQNEITPGHLHLEDLAAYIQRGIAEAGGCGIRMNAGIGVCDGIAMGHDGMKYSLPSRELNRDCVVDMVMSHGIFEGLVFIGACDKNIPGYLMAAANLDLPTIFVTTGPMMPGTISGECVDVVTSFSADAQYALGKISTQEYENIIEESCPTCGSCAGLFTANSMACVTEALGLTIPYMATTHAVDNKKYRLATESGRRIMHLIEKKITAKAVMTEKAFYNALAVDMAIGASTNTVLHVPAIAKEAGIILDLDRINDISARTPNILKLSPASRFRMVDFDRAGGIPLVMSRLKSLLHLDVITVTGPLNERLKMVLDHEKTDVIKNIKEPYSKTGGIAVYRGNLAPSGSVIKESAVHPSVPTEFEGTARVFNDESDATRYIKSGQIQKGDILIIRYEGPAGGPGMREMLYPTSSISGLGLEKEVALITDGRFSGGTAGICIGHVEPEAYIGGPIALVQTGDKITINRKTREINLLISETEFAKRKQDWKRVEKPADTSLLQNFRNKFTEKS